jgi:hypothetical protein
MYVAPLPSRALNRFLDGWTQFDPYRFHWNIPSAEPGSSIILDAAQAVCV